MPNDERQITKEARMTKAELPPVHCAADSAFEVRPSFVMRQASLVIRGLSFVIA
jgi:hypothetical protein